MGKSATLEKSVILLGDAIDLANKANTKISGGDPNSGTEARSLLEQSWEKVRKVPGIPFDDLEEAYCDAIGNVRDYLSGRSLEPAMLTSSIQVYAGKIKSAIMGL